MTIIKNLNYVIFFIFVTAFSGFAQNNAETSLHLLGDFAEDWEKDWIERKLPVKPTKYEVAEEDSNKVLMATSIQGSSALWRMVSVKPEKFGKISWRWKIQSNYSDKKKEKTKMGDDYVARLYVIFEPHLVSWKTRSLCYVWAAKEPVGSMYKSPYASTSGIIVLQSGKENKKKWMQEERDFVADYHKVFGKNPQMVTGVAIMVDSDNTNQEAMTWFDDIVLKAGSAKKRGTRKRPIIKLFDK